MQNSVYIFQGRFMLSKHLGKGGFGDVFEGTEVATGERIAVKLEKRVGNSFLYHEARVLQGIILQRRSCPTRGFPTLKYFGQEGEYRILIMSIHGPSLEDIHEKLDKFSLKTTLMLGLQMVQRIQWLHNAGYVHRDLKPDNFLMGADRLSTTLYLIDFGLSTKCVNAEGLLRPMESGKSFVGTTRYASLNTHLGFSQSCRDDIEQMIYIMIYLYRGRLPWSGLRIHNREEKERCVGAMKNDMHPAKICEGCPSGFEDLLIYSRKMEYSEMPRYEMVTGAIELMLESINTSNDLRFDWLISPQERDMFQSPQQTSQNGFILSDAEAQGMLSGFSGDMQQDITSLNGDEAVNR